MFENYPSMREAFKDRENYTAEDVQKDPFFVKQGLSIIIKGEVCFSEHYENHSYNVDWMKVHMLINANVETQSLNAII